MKQIAWFTFVFSSLLSYGLASEQDVCTSRLKSAKLRHLITHTCPPDFNERCNDFKIFDPLEAIPYPCGHGHAPFMDLDRVDVLNASTLQEWLQHKDPLHRTWCMIVLFYIPTCTFSHKIAPAFNAVPQNFRNLKAVALDATDFTRLNSRYGIAGSPSVLLFINGLPVSRIDYEPLTTSGLRAFITEHTDVSVVGSVTAPEGPVLITPDEDQGYILLVFYLFIVSLTAAYCKRDCILTSPVAQSLLPRLGLAPDVILNHLNGQ